MYKVTTAPASEPIQLSEIKDYLKVDYDTDDSMLTRLIRSAREWVEKQCNIGLLPQTITQVYDGWPVGREIELGVSPVRAVSSIHYRDQSGTAQLWAASNYTVDTYERPGRVQRKYSNSYPTAIDEINSVSAVYTVGFDSASSIPGPLVEAMYLVIADAYENRQDYVRKQNTAAEYKLETSGYRAWVFR